MIPLKRYLFRKVTIVGVGLIGGSLGKAIRKHRLAREVMGLSHRHQSLSLSVKNGAVDHGSLDVKKAVSNADLVVLAAPVGVVTGMLTTIGPYLKRNCIVTDVGSTKATIVHAANEHLPQGVHFVGAHPLAGSHRQGVQFADEDLFRQALCVVTPVEQTHRGACERVKRLWTAVGAHVRYLSPEEHDKIVASISHLPHLMAFALMRVVPKERLSFAAQGFKDSTRIGASPAQLWSDICLANSKNVVNGLDDMVKELGQFRRAICTGDSKTLVQLFREAQNKRENMGE